MKIAGYLQPAAPSIRSMGVRITFQTGQEGREDYAGCLHQAHDPYGGGFIGVAAPTSQWIQMTYIAMDSKGVKIDKGSALWYFEKCLNWQVFQSIFYFEVQQD